MMLHLSVSSFTINSLVHYLSLFNIVSFDQIDNTASQHEDGKSILLFAEVLEAETEINELGADFLKFLLINSSLFITNFQYHHTDATAHQVLKTENIAYTPSLFKIATFLFCADLRI